MKDIVSEHYRRQKGIEVWSPSYFIDTRKIIADSDFGVPIKQSLLQRIWLLLKKRFA